MDTDNRRDFLKRSGAILTAVSGMAALAGCTGGVDESDSARIVGEPSIERSGEVLIAEAMVQNLTESTQDFDVEFQPTYDGSPVGYAEVGYVERVPPRGEKPCTVTFDLEDSGENYAAANGVEAEI